MTKEQIKKKLNLYLVGEFYEGRALVVKNGKWGHVDLNGNITTPIIYDGVGHFQEGRAWVKKNGKEGYVDLNGKIVIPLIYDDVGYFKKGRAWVKINKVIYINKNGYPLKHEDFYKLIKEIFNAK